MAPTFLTIFMINLIFVQSRTDLKRGFPFLPNDQSHLEIYSNALSRAHYNPWTCNYKSEPGYKCLSCSEALHCYPSDFALLVQCAGLFPYCRNGYCSMWRTEGCNEDYMFAEGTHGPLRVTTPSQNVTTSSVDENLSTEATEKVPVQGTQTTVATSESTASNKVENIVEKMKANVIKNPRQLL